jgi:hypothetical protein
MHASGSGPTLDSLHRCPSRLEWLRMRRQEWVPSVRRDPLVFLSFYEHGGRSRKRSTGSGSRPPGLSSNSSRLPQLRQIPHPCWSPLPPSARRCYPAVPDSPNAWPCERGRVTRAGYPALAGVRRISPAFRRAISAHRRRASYRLLPVPAREAAASLFPLRPDHPAASVEDFAAPAHRELDQQYMIHTSQHDLQPPWQLL